ncbi:MAG: CheR family methyltransferase, partial [Myxococcota bacterium]
GEYSQLEVNRGLPAKMLLKYFDRRGIRWQVKPHIRERLQIRELNLIHPWPSLPPLDIIFIRNVMIYFNIKTKRQILSNLRRVLRPGGFLFLGGAETTLGVDKGFERFPFPKASCYRLKD